MELNIGDKVRFLNAVGGGVVSGFQKGGIVLVEDEDGFDIPVRQNEVVVVPADNKQAYMEKVEPKATMGKKPIPTYSSAKTANASSQPASQAPQPISPENKLKAQSSREADLEQRIIQLEMTVHQLTLRLERLENARQDREAQKKQDLAQREEQKHSSQSNKQPGLLEVDLHINELLDSTQGLSPADIKAYQLKVFRETMEANKGRKGQRIVFIHGNGEGVLRKAIIDELRHSYKSCEYQDASFQQYGFGATLVIIH